jgi:glutamate synthase domain-containing protein 1
MCGIAGVIHRGGTADIGLEMTSMLQSLKHRGPDSTGFAIYGKPNLDEYIMRFSIGRSATARRWWMPGWRRRAPS